MSVVSKGLIVKEFCPFTLRSMYVPCKLGHKTLNIHSIFLFTVSPVLCWAYHSFERVEPEGLLPTNKAVAVGRQYEMHNVGSAPVIKHL